MARWGTLCCVAAGASLLTAGLEPGPFIDESGLPFIPFGFYQYTVTEAHDRNLPQEEAAHGFTLTSPYASTAAPDDQWWSHMTAFLDDAHAAGYKVNYQLIAFEKLGNDNATLANLTEQVLRFKDHPAILAWYLADEPDYQGIPAETLEPKYKAIKALDSKHPVSMVFCCASAKPYLQTLDLIMVDPYPIPNQGAETVLDSLDAVIDLGKPVMLVPQSFGGGENWARSPSIQEERLMTYLGLIRGVVGVQYFVRSAEIGFPYAAAAWSEIRQMAAEVRELQSALLGGQPVPALINATHSSCQAAAAAWQDRDGSVVLLVASLTNQGPACTFSLDVGRDASMDVVEIFENRVVAQNLPKNQGVQDAFRGYGTGAYRFRLRTSPPQPADAAELVYNPSFEINVNAAVPDGNYVGAPGDIAGTFFSDSRLSIDGLHALRLHAPSAGNSPSLSPYTIPVVQAQARYSFSLWAKGAKGGEILHFDFTQAVFTLQNSSDNTLVVEAGMQWAQVNATLIATADPKTACPYGCRSWLRYALMTAGDVWLDSLSLQASAAFVI